MSLLSKIDIAINQKPLTNFQHISIDQNLYGIDSFEIICRYDVLEKLDGFIIEKSKDFLGLPIVIQTKFLVNDEEEDGLSFLGYVTEIQSSRSTLADNDMVIISGGSKEIILDRKPTNRAFVNNTLEEIVREVLKKYELKSKISTRTKTRFPYIVQFEESDLAFLKRLSIRYGEWCYFNGQDFIFGEIPAGQNAQTLTIGSNLKNFQYGIRANPVKFSIFTIDPKKHDTYQYRSGNSKIEGNLNMYGKHALKMSKTLFTEEGRDYYEHINVNESDYKKGLDQVGETEEAVNAVNLTDLSGSSFNGFLNSGREVKVECLKQDGKGKIDYGKYIITSIQHDMDNTLDYENNFTAIPVETSIPENTDPYFIRTSSHQVGIVIDNQDPDKLGRIKIKFLWMDGQESTPWVKVASPYTYKDAGFYFVPAIDSRVLVGFEDGDVEKPYCIGTLFDEVANPDPDWVGSTDDGNAKIHAIRTQSGNTIILRDSGGPGITIYDKGNKNQIIFDSGNEKLSMHSSFEAHVTAKEMASIGLGDKDKPDQNETYIWIQKDFIHIGAKNGNIEINSENKNVGIRALNGKIYLQGLKIVLDAKESVEIKAPNVKIDGQATAELSGGATTTIKGGVVKIN